MPRTVLKDANQKLLHIVTFIDKNNFQQHVDVNIELSYIFLVPVPAPFPVFPKEKGIQIFLIFYDF